MHQRNGPPLVDDKPLLEPVITYHHMNPYIMVKLACNLHRN